MASTIKAQGRLPLKGGVGTVGVTVFEADGETVAVARSTTGIVEVPENSGLYIAEKSIPGDQRLLYARFDDGGDPPRYTLPQLTANYDPIAVVDAVLDMEGSFDAVSGYTVDNVDIVPARTATLGTRADGVTITDRVLAARAGEELPWFVDCSKFAGGRNLTSATSPASSNELAFEIMESGSEPRCKVQRDHVVIWLRAVNIDGASESDITFNLTPASGQTIKVKMSMRIDDD